MSLRVTPPATRTKPATAASQSSNPVCGSRVAVVLAAAAVVVVVVGRSATVVAIGVVGVTGMVDALVGGVAVAAPAVDVSARAGAAVVVYAGA
ncbi:MAG: hypothetical protein ACLP50_16425, partial [Solirubrobacteraceae bacterium]